MPHVLYSRMHPVQDRASQNLSRCFCQVTPENIAHNYYKKLSLDQSIPGRVYCNVETYALNREGIGHVFGFGPCIGYVNQIFTMYKYLFRIKISKKYCI